MGQDLLCRPACFALSLALACFSTPAAANDPTSNEAGWDQYFDDSVTGFGGVALGRAWYPAISDDLKDVGWKEGALSIRSSFFARLGQSDTLFTGFAVTVNMVNHQDIITGEIWPAEDNLPSVTGANTWSLGILHIPVEANVAWRESIGSHIEIFGGSGVSVHVVRVTSTVVESGIFTWGEAEDALIYVSYADLGGTTTETEYGTQFFGGFGVLFGELPGIGGNWGLSAQGLYTRVTKLEMAMDGSQEYYEYGIDGNPTGWSEQVEFSIPTQTFNLSHLSASAALNFHF